MMYQLSGVWVFDLVNKFFKLWVVWKLVTGLFGNMVCNVGDSSIICQCLWIMLEIFWLFWLKGRISGITWFVLFLFDECLFVCRSSCLVKVNALSMLLFINCKGYPLANKSLVRVVRVRVRVVISGEYAGYLSSWSKI